MGSETTYGQTTDDKYGGQPVWGEAPSDSLQYELFLGERFLSIRALKFPTSTFTYAWLFDGSARGLFSSCEPLAGDRSGPMTAANRNLSYTLDERGGVIEVRPDAGAPIRVEMRETVSTLWRFPPDDVVIHQPLLEVTCTRGSETWTGQGYCKRYTCGAENEHMYWRFITGPADDGAGWFWTAEAAFNLKKYDYFKTASADGKVLTAAQPGTWHRDRMACGAIEGVEHRVEIQDLGRIEHDIRQGGTNTKISQAFCRASFSRGDRMEQSYALNEIACGIHG
ncbi:MAG: hypothetical protein AAF441_20680 [Pseudomonadota bacterium]